MKEELFSTLGKAIFSIQYLEDTLGHAIVIKTNPRNIPKSEADKKLNKNRKKTFGSALTVIKKKSLLSDDLIHNLEKLLKERNWLVHRSIAHNALELHHQRVLRDILIRIKQIIISSEMLNCEVEEDLINYCESLGADMSEARAYLESYKNKSKSNDDRKI